MDWLQNHVKFFIQFIPFTFKNKGSLCISVVPWRTSNIHGIFPLHKMFFIVKKTVILRIVHLCFLGNKNSGSSMALLWKLPFWTFIFKCWIAIQKKRFSLQISISGYHNLPNYVNWLLKALTLYLDMFRIMVSLALFIFNVTYKWFCKLRLLILV